MLGITLKVEKITGGVQFNVDDYGTALCQAHGVGLNTEQFTDQFSKNSVPAYVWNSNEWVCSRMKWKIVETTQVYEAIISDKDIFSKALDSTIPSGKVIGLKAIVTTVAETSTSKVVLISEQIGKVYDESQADFTAWQIHGTPSIDIEIKKPDTVGITCASAINRLSWVKKARSGYVPTCDLGPMC